MLSSHALKQIVAEARPIIERQLDDADQIAALREVVTAQGGDWSALKALIKAQVQDERDEAGDGKRVRKILDKADYATTYAGLLGLANMNEQNFSAAETTIHNTSVPAGFDPETVEEVTTPFFVESANNEPQPETAEQSQGITSAPTASFAGTEGDEGQHPIQPETANEVGDEFSHVAGDAAGHGESDRREDAGDFSNAGGENVAAPNAEAAEAVSDNAANTLNPSENEGAVQTGAPTKRNWSYTDEPDPRCLNPKGCGGYSRSALCGKCRQKAGLAVDHHEVDA